MAPVVDLNALRRKANPSFVAVKPSKRKFGVDYLPPMTASLLNVVPLRHPKHTADLLAKVANILPDSFDWSNKVDVATKRMFASASDASKVASILQPQNQLGCGSCWAFATSSTLSDRYTLFQGLKQSLKLSPTYLLACNTNPNNGCGGGYPGSAGKFFETTGIPTSSCQDYGWCPTSGEVDNSEIPACTEIKRSCYTDLGDGTVNPSYNIKTFYKAVPGTTQVLPTPDAIKAELWHNGPVTATFHVFADFVGRSTDMSNKAGWVNTSNIYINLTDPNDPMPSSTGLYDGYSPTELLGGHAVVIVGWGVESNPKGLPAELKAKLPNGKLYYWKVRNSWDTPWNGDGFFKIAMSVPELNINMTVVLDRSTFTQGMSFGGGTTFLPVVDEPTPKVFTSPPTGGGNGGGGNGGGGNGGGGGGGNGGGGGGGKKPSPIKPTPKPTPTRKPLGDTDTGGTGGTSGTTDNTNFWTQPGGIAVIIIVIVVVVIFIIAIPTIIKHKKGKRLSRR
jgi:hypothetical protein